MSFWGHYEWSEKDNQISAVMFKTKDDAKILFLSKICIFAFFQIDTSRQFNFLSENRI